MPRESFPAGVREAIITHASIATAAATVSADFSANTLQTIVGGAGGVLVGQRCEVTKLKLRIGDADFVGGGGTLTFELRKNSATGLALASLVVPVASALRGVTLEASVTAALAAAARLVDTDTLFLVRLATGTAYTTGAGLWEVEAWVRPQSRR